MRLKFFMLRMQVRIAITNVVTKIMDDFVNNTHKMLDKEIDRYF